MPAIDLRTFALLGTFSYLAFAAITLAVWRFMPHERGLRHWFPATLLMALGALEIALRTPASSWWSIPTGNTLFTLGYASLLIALRRLLRQPEHRAERLQRWLGPAATFAWCGGFTWVVPSLTARLIGMSLMLAGYFTAFAATFASARIAGINSWLRASCLLQVIGALLFVARAVSAPHAAVAIDYSSAASLLLIGPGLFAMLFNVWLAITMVLVITGHARQQVETVLRLQRDILERSPLATAVYRAEGRCVLRNEAYRHLMEETSETDGAPDWRSEPAWRAAGLVEECERALAGQDEHRCELHLTTRSGRALWLDCSIQPTRLNDEEHLLLQFVDLTERKQLEEQLRQMAFHDPLTRLPNRRLLMERIAGAQQRSARQHNHGALLFIDLDRFKALNDRHGHGYGDLLLMEVAMRLSQQVRQGDTVARLGGDEFVVLLEGLAEEEGTARQQALAMADQLRQALAGGYRLDNIDHSASASIGVCLFCGDAATPEQLLGDADEAMYRVKPAREPARNR